MKKLFILAIIFTAAAFAAEEPAPPPSLYIKPFDGAEEALKNLDVLIQSQKWAEAARLAQRLMNQPLPLHETDGLLIPFNEFVRLKVLAWPQPAQAAFVDIYEAEADALFESAFAARDIAKLSSVAKKYPATKAASSALEAIAEIKLQRGEFGEALAAFDELMKYAKPERLGPLDKKKKQVAALLANEKPALAHAKKDAAYARAPWIHTIEDANVDGLMAKDFAEKHLAAPLIMTAVTDGSRVFYQTKSYVAAVDPASGEKIWQHPEKPIRPSRTYLHGAVSEPALCGGSIYSFIAGKVSRLDAATGKVLWNTPLDFGADGAPARAILVNSIAASPAYVLVTYAEIRQETLFSATALDARTGKTLWRQRLCSQVFTGWLGRGIQPAPPVIRDGVGYAVTNLGAIAAFDMETGEVKWAARYPSFEPDRRVAALRSGRHFENNRPVLYGNILVAAPMDLDYVIAFDIASGKAVWQLPRLGMKYITGTLEEKVFLAGRGARAVDIASGKIVWSTKDNFTATARPDVYADRLLVPLAGSILSIDARTGEAVKVAAPEIPSANIAASGDSVFAVSNDALFKIELLKNAPAPVPVRQAEPKVLSGDNTLRQIWHLPLDTAHRAVSLLASDDINGRLYISTADRDRFESQNEAIVCRDRADGRLVWRRYFDGPHFDVHLEEGILLLRNFDKVIALDSATGAEKWSADAAREGGGVFSSALESGIFVTSAKNTIIGIDAETGKQAWQVPVEPEAIHIASHNGRIFIAGETSGKIEVRDAATGKLLHSRKIVAADARITDTPAIQKETGRLALAIGDREVQNFRVESGEMIWKREMPFAVGRIEPHEGKRLIIFPDRWSFGGKVTCLDAENGKVLWENSIISREPEDVLVYRGFMAGTKMGVTGKTVAAYSLADGKLLWVHPLPAKHFEKAEGGGEYVAAFGSEMRSEGWLTSVQVMTAGGKLLKQIKFWGSENVSSYASGSVLLFFTSRGVFAFDMLSEESAEKNLAAARVGESAEASALARLLNVTGRTDEAVETLEKYLLSESNDPMEFLHCHEQLMAIREEEGAESPAIYRVPRAKFAPVFNGQMADDLRIDRAAMLNRPMNIQSINQKNQPPVMWHGPNDLSAILYLAWDDENLYIQIDVNDDVITPHDFTDERWNGDCLIVATSHEGGYDLGLDDEIFWLALSAKPNDNERRDRIRGEHRVKIKPDKTGLVYELALPLSFLKIRPEAGSSVRLNLAIVDDDGAGAYKAATWAPGLKVDSKKHAITESIAPIMFGTIILER